MDDLIFRNPFKTDLITLYDLVHEGEFTGKDVSDKLETTLRGLCDRKIIIKTRKVVKGHWIYRINPTYCFYLKRGELPSIGKV